jgi:hypothetical protein
MVRQGVCGHTALLVECQGVKACIMLRQATVRHMLDEAHPYTVQAWMDVSNHLPVRDCCLNSCRSSMNSAMYM